MWKIGIVGFGNVGQGLASLLASKKEALLRRYGFEFVVTAIATAKKGNLYEAFGLDLEELLERAAQKKSFIGHPALFEGDALSLIREKDVDLWVEVTPTNLVDGQPGLDHIRTALERGRHVVTTNKGPVALALDALKALSREKGVEFRYEGVVMSGTPVISMAQEGLAGCEILGLRGIVNGTTNFILTEMEAGKSYDEALRKAQELGYAEADPTADVEGWDAAVKTSIMASVFMGEAVPLEQIPRRGISHLSVEDLRKALAHGRRIKLIAEITRAKGEPLKASVAPVELPVGHPLAGIGGAANAITFITDTLGEVTLVGPGAGRLETGQALLSDILAIHRLTARKGHSL